VNAQEGDKRTWIYVILTCLVLIVAIRDIRNSTKYRLCQPMAPNRHGYTVVKYPAISSDPSEIGLPRYSSSKFLKAVIIASSDVCKSSKDPLIWNLHASGNKRQC
jgi:hypothetical protein